MPKINFQSCILGFSSLIHYVTEMRNNLYYLPHMKDKNPVTPQTFSFPEEKCLTFSHRISFTHVSQASLDHSCSPDVIKRLPRQTREKFQIRV